MNEAKIRSAGNGDAAVPALSGGDPVSPTRDPRGVNQLFLDHYGLNEQPFGVTPDPRFLYFGSKHRQALAALNYGTESNRGFLTLIAKPGMGKTSLLFQYLEDLRGRARTVFLFQTDGDSSDLMRYLLSDLGIDGAGKDLCEMRSILTQVFMEEMRVGRRFVLVIDEAQNLDEKVLESIRLLSNCETRSIKLIQIVLAGQPELAERLAKPSMAQLRQRISFAIRIEPLIRAEIDAYVDHRLRVAGYDGPPLFSGGARALLAESSEGIPRNINNMCFYAMSLGWATNQKTIDRKMMCDVLEDLDFELPTKKSKPAPKLEDELKHSNPQAVRSADSTLKELITARLNQTSSNIGKLLELSGDAIPATVKSADAERPALLSQDPGSRAGPEASSISPNREAPYGNDGPGAPKQEGGRSPLED